ncbi:putative nuclease HARBI1 [Ixodes scapularis]
MAAWRSDVAERISAFEFATRACDVVFGDAFPLPRVPRPSIRDRENPMERYNDGQFLARYRFTKGTVRELLGMLPLQTSTDCRGLPLTPMLQLLVTLRFYGAGTFQVVTGDLVNVSQPTVCRAVGVVTQLIARHLFQDLVHFPSAAQFNTVMLDFFALAKFPGVTGCIDCTHVRIKSPGGDDAEVFRHRKGVFSINVQAVTGPQLQFYDVVVSWPGSVHDSRIFDNSRVRVLYEERRVPGVLLGDMGYACFFFLMTPLADPGPANTPRGRYQKAHIKTRNSVERAFGIWKRRFPCLDMRLQHKPRRAVQIITACAALHNLACLRKDPQPPPPPAPPVVPRARRPRRRATRPVHLPPAVDTVEDSLTGIQKREQIIERSFK